MGTPMITIAALLPAALPRRRRSATSRWISAATTGRRSLGRRRRRAPHRSHPGRHRRASRHPHVCLRGRRDRRASRRPAPRGRGWLGQHAVEPSAPSSRPGCRRAWARAACRPSGEALIGNGCPMTCGVAGSVSGAEPARRSSAAYTDADDGWRWDFVDSVGGRRLTRVSRSAARAGRAHLRGAARADGAARCPVHARRAAPTLRCRASPPAAGASATGRSSFAARAHGVGAARLPPPCCYAEGPTGGRCPGARVDERRRQPPVPWTLSLRNGPAIRSASSTARLPATRRMCRSRCC